jgi:hypothetical protein
MLTDSRYLERLYRIPFHVALGISPLVRFLGRLPWKLTPTRGKGEPARKTRHDKLGLKRIGSRAEPLQCAPKVPYVPTPLVCYVQSKLPDTNPFQITRANPLRL